MSGRGTGSCPEWPRLGAGSGGSSGGHDETEGTSGGTNGGSTHTIERIVRENDSVAHYPILT